MEVRQKDMRTEEEKCTVEPTTPNAANLSESICSCRGYFSKSSFGPNWVGLTKMDATTTSFSALACRTSVRCPVFFDPVRQCRPFSSDFSHPAYPHARLPLLERTQFLSSVRWLFVRNERKQSFDGAILRRSS